MRLVIADQLSVALWNVGNQFRRGGVAPLGWQQGRLPRTELLTKQLSPDLPSEKLRKCGRHGVPKLALDG